MLRSTTHRRWPRLAARLAVTAVALLAPAARSAALAQTACDDQAAIMRLLKEQYAEVPAAIGLGLDGRVLELFSSPEGLTWSLVATSPRGRSCIIAVGRYWTENPAPIAGLQSSWRPPSTLDGSLP